MASMSNLLPNPNTKEDADPINIQLYQSAIGSLMYIMLGTWPASAKKSMKLWLFGLFKVLRRAQRAKVS